MNLRIASVFRFQVLSALVLLAVTLLGTACGANSEPASESSTGPETSNGEAASTDSAPSKISRPTCPVSSPTKPGSQASSTKTSRTRGCHAEIRSANHTDWSRDGPMPSSTKNAPARWTSTTMFPVRPGHRHQPLSRTLM